MLSNYEIKRIARAIIGFTESNTKNKQEKQNEQSDSESTLSLDQVASGLDSIFGQILRQKSFKFVIQIPKLLQSLIALVNFRLGTHLREQMDLQRQQVRYLSRLCLKQIKRFGDEYVQSELIRQGFGRVLSIAFCTAGGAGGEEDGEINDGLGQIYKFLRDIHEGRYDDLYPSFQPLPLLVRRTEEQIEEEGAIEEIEAQMNNKGYYGGIKYQTNEAKEVTLNHFVNWD
ncbi:MAG: hypothetical protein EZS28_012664 [Streblomastix strix]|uniref:Uncharacterized protein n=1 Tax=Streblomastix strix TaxID=222440 RepID=A0A5J4WAX2_9EUKA|nr:MAG: hypothetical protein EZS28_012664 [Streblomastix strix]